MLLIPTPTETPVPPPAEGEGVLSVATPTPSVDTFVSPILPTPLPPTPSLFDPEFPPTPADPDAWWVWPCNAPAQHWPDGCDTWSPLEPPDHPLTPPCIRTAYAQTVPSDDFPDVLDTQLIVVVDHPEYANYTPRDARLVILRLQPAYGSSAWDADDGDWWFKCGRDEAPLAWTVREALNTRSLAPFDMAYNAPLPAPFVALVADLIAAPPDPSTPTPSPTMTPTAAPGSTVVSPLPTPAP